MDYRGVFDSRTTKRKQYLVGFKGVQQKNLDDSCVLERQEESGINCHIVIKEKYTKLLKTHVSTLHSQLKLCYMVSTWLSVQRTCGHRCKLLWLEFPPWVIIKHNSIVFNYALLYSTCCAFCCVGGKCHLPPFSLGTVVASCSWISEQQFPRRACASKL